MVFCDWLAHLCNVFKNHPYRSIYQYFITFHCQVMFHFMDITHFVYPFINWWTFGLILLLAVLSNATVNIHVQFLCGHMFSFLLGILLRMKLLGHIVTMFNHLRNCLSILQSGCIIFHSFPPAMYEGSKFFTSLTDFCYFLTFWQSYTNECKVVSHCGFDLHFPDG